MNTPHSLSERFSQVFATASGELKPTIDPERDLVEEGSDPNTGNTRLTVGFDAYSEPQVLREHASVSGVRTTVLIRSLGSLSLEDRLLVDSDAGCPIQAGVTVEVDGDDTNRRRYTLPDEGTAVVQRWEPWQEGTPGEYPGRFGQPSPLEAGQEIGARQLAAFILANAEHLATDWIGIVAGKPEPRRRTW